MPVDEPDRRRRRPGHRSRAGSRIPAVRLRPRPGARPQRVRRQRCRRRLHRGPGRRLGRRRVPRGRCARVRGWLASTTSRSPRSTVRPEAGFSIVEQPRRPRRHVDPAGHRRLRRLPRGDARPGRPSLRLPLHRLHELRSALHHRHRAALRPAADHDGRLPDVPRLPGGVRRSGLSPVPRPADRLPRLRTAPVARRSPRSSTRAAVRADRGDQGHRRLPPGLRCTAIPTSVRGAASAQAARRQAVRADGGRPRRGPRARAARRHGRGGAPVAGPAHRAGPVARRRRLQASVAPGNAYLGVLLPTPRCTTCCSTPVRPTSW